MFVGIVSSLKMVFDMVYLKARRVSLTPGARCTHDGTLPFPLSRHSATIPMATIFGFRPSANFYSMTRLSRHLFHDRVSTLHESNDFIYTYRGYNQMSFIFTFISLHLHSRLHVLVLTTCAH